jgi:cytochrome b561
LSVRPRPERWGPLPIALHWLVALIIAALIVIGWRMVHGELSAAETFDAYQLHKSLGFLALALTVARLAARVRFPSPPKPQAPRWERRLASFTQGALIVLTIGASLAGWLVVSVSPLPIPTRFFNLFVIPNIARPDAALFAAAVLAHKVAAWTITGLAALHVAGALKHHLIDRDDVLRRMLPARALASPVREKGRGG